MTRTRALVAAASLALAAGCSRGGDHPSATDACVDRLRTRVEEGRYSDDERAVVVRYARETYCERFAREGWVADDGTLSIDAHHWAMGAGTSECAEAEVGGEVRTVPCAPVESEPLLDCALLHHVRRDEVSRYLRGLERRLRRPVECDDGTPPDELGVR